jgi:hypothetical protein
MKNVYPAGVPVRGNKNWQISRKLVILSAECLFVMYALQ